MTRKLIAVLAAVVAAVPVHAGTLRYGPASFAPYYGFESRYEDNIYRVHRDINGHAVSGGGVRGSWIFDNNLGLKTNVALTSQSSLKAAYDVVFQNYTTQSDANNAVNSKAGAAYEYRGSKITGRLGDDYVNTQDPAFNPNGTVINGALVSRERHWENTFGGQAEYALGEKFFFGLDAKTYLIRYLNHSGGATSLANTLNRSELTFGLKTGYQVLPKTRVFTAVHQSATHFTEKTRSDGHRNTSVDFGVEGDLTSRLTGLVQTGFLYQKYDVNASNRGFQTAGRHWSFLTKLDYKASELSTVSLTANRQANDSATTASRYYLSSGLNLAYTRQLGAKWSTAVNGGVQIDKYSDAITIGTGANLLKQSRRDDNYQAGVKLDYKMHDWVTTGLSYTHNSRFSTFSRQFSYKDNITGVNVRLMF